MCSSLIVFGSICLNNTGNYYGTPRPVHISTDSPPITYQEHRNLLRNFRTRSKSLSNLEKAAEDGDNSEDDSGLSGKYWLNLVCTAPCVEYKSVKHSFDRNISGIFQTYCQKERGLLHPAV